MGELVVTVWRVLVVDGVVEEDGHDRPTVVTVPHRHSQLLVHFLKLQQLHAGGGAKGNIVVMITLWNTQCVGPMHNSAHCKPHPL